jgi:hypothetical protein
MTLRRLLGIVRLRTIGMQKPIPSSRKLASGLAADPQLYGAKEEKVTSMVRLFHETDLTPLHRMICDTIEASYSGVYPPRAVEFFKEYHMEKRIAERSVVGEILVLEEDVAAKWPKELLRKQ